MVGRSNSYRTGSLQELDSTFIQNEIPSSSTMRPKLRAASLVNSSQEFHGCSQIQHPELDPCRTTIDSDAIGEYRFHSYSDLRPSHDPVDSLHDILWMVLILGKLGNIRPIKKGS
ncbi:hypothetical protein VNO77_44825 [Canavalia gladiata]|uniref:Uncharacterized protein n=1 Tax=Canavalia gladiata TaxID=3824 RepID=A0AAN9JWK3_CANGL